MGRYFDDELYHWKYKRRYKGPSGEWVYVYDDGSMSARGETKTSTSETNAFGNTDITEKRVVTNPDRWLSKKSVKESTVTKTVNEDGNVRTKTINKKTETVERGKLHIAKMNLKRKVSEIPGDTVRLIKKNHEWNKKMRASEPKDQNSKDHKKWEKKYHMVPVKEAKLF